MDIESVRVHQLGPDDWHRFRRIRLLALAEAPYAFGSTLAQARARTDQDWRDLLAARTQFLGTAGDHDLGTVGEIAENNAAHLNGQADRFGDTGPVRGGGRRDGAGRRFR
ncbi:hypothetical protein [Nocardia sp. NPDC005366]|uniref:hypothetical protein n=1 Tax=Nocardia sp. NPDC005366 TaxID=3156878 RepID=UPI0033A08711